MASGVVGFEVGIHQRQWLRSIADWLKLDLYTIRSLFNDLEVERSRMTSKVVWVGTVEESDIKMKQLSTASKFFNGTT